MKDGLQFYPTPATAPAPAAPAGPIRSVIESRPKGARVLEGGAT